MSTFMTETLPRYADRLPRDAQKLHGPTLTQRRVLQSWEMHVELCESLVSKPVVYI